MEKLCYWLQLHSSQLSKVLTKKVGVIGFMDEVIVVVVARGHLGLAGEHAAEHLKNSTEPAREL